MDTDSVLEPDALARIVRALLDNATTVAAGGVVRIVNGCRVRSGVTPAFPYYFFLVVFGPIIESVGYLTFIAALILGRASIPFVLAFLAVAFAFGIALSFAAIGLEELSFRRDPRFRGLVTLLGVAIVENVGYRQPSTDWRVKGMVSKLTGAKSWGAMERKGFQASSGGPA